MKRCRHCLAEIEDGKEIKVEEGGETLFFCCTGCASVYSIIRGAGLDSFYRKRSGWKPGPPEVDDIPISEFDKSVSEKGDDAEITISVRGIRCVSCAWLIERYLERLKGIKEARMNFATHRLRVVFKKDEIELKEILESVRSLGYSPAPSLFSGAEAQARAEKRDLLLRFGTSAFFTMQLMLITGALYAGYFKGMEEEYRKAFKLISLALSTPVVFYGGFPFLSGTLRSIKTKALSMDVLIFLGAFTAYSYSVVAALTGREVYFDTASMIITLILLGRFLESSGRLKAEELTQVLSALLPEKAIKVDGDQEVEVHVSSLSPGDAVRVKQGDRVPLDGEIIDGEIEIDQSAITGEATPVLKSRGDRIVGGTFVVEGSAVAKIDTRPGDTLVARIVQLIGSVEGEKTPIKRLADRIVSIFVPAVIGVAAATFVGCLSYGLSTPASLLRAVSVLVVACPCALGLATPMALTLAGSACASKGIIIKEGVSLEVGGKVGALFIDKTGTLTEGKPRVTDIVPFGIDEKKLVSIAASLEKQSSHPIAKAITSLGEDTELLDVDGFKSHVGRGVEGVVQGKRCHLGTPSFMREIGIRLETDKLNLIAKLESDARTVICLAVENSIVGLFGLKDSVRKEAHEAVARLADMGIDTIMLTGDGKVPAEKAAEEAGIKNLFHSQLPDDKVRKINAMTENGKVTAMLGDGVNDAAALRAASVGISMGQGTDIAIESASVVLLRDDLSLVPDFFRLSRKTLNIIKQNLAWAFSYNAIAIPLAVAGVIHPVISALLMAVSSLMVVFNSMRIHGA